MNTFLRTFGLFAVTALAVTGAFILFGHNSAHSIDWTLDLLISYITYRLLKENGV